MPDDDVASRIRMHCENGLLYAIWALARLDPEKQSVDVNMLQSQAMTLATIVAFLDGALAEREAGFVAKERIIPAFEERAKSWTPPWRDDEMRSERAW